MFMEIFGFELRQQLKTPLFWVFLVLFFIGGVALTSSPMIVAGGAVGNVHINAPVVIARLSIVFAGLSTLFVVVFIASAMLRDFDQGTAETIFSTPVSRGSYLGGRFAAGFLIALAIAVASLIGMLMGTLMPWVDATRLGPLTLAPWLWSFGTIVLPDMIFIGTLLFLLAALTRSLLAMFVGVIVVIALQAVAANLMLGLDHHLVSSMVNPYGGQALQDTVRYWTAHNYNTQLPPFDGVLMANRIIWLLVSAAMFAGGFLLFRPNREGLRLRWPWRRRRQRAAMVNVPVTLTLPSIATHQDAHALWQQFVSITRMDLRGIMRGVLFPLMLLFGLIILTSILLTHGKAYGTAVYPVTHLMVTDVKGSMSLFLLIVLFFFAGELIWRNRKFAVSDVIDATGAPSWIALTSKATTLALIVVIFLVVGAIYTIGYQLIEGYTHLQLGVYAVGLGLAAIGFILMGILALVLQVLANNKFLGYLWFIVFLVGSALMGYLGWGDNLYNYGGGPSTPYSALNGWGHFLAGALWFDLYWALGAALLMVLGTLFWVRGTDRGKRWRNAGSRLCRRPLQITLLVTLAGFIGCGAWVYYNTHVLNAYITGDQGKQYQAEYEKLYSKYANAPQPRITAIDSKVDIYPYQRKLDMHVVYTLVNKHKAPIDKLYVNWTAGVPPTHVSFAPHTTIKRDTLLGFSIYKLDTPLAPGASMTYSFDVRYDPHGFKNNLGPLDTRLIHNGTFLTNRSLPLPTIGYDRQYQLTGKSDRRKYGLPPEPRTPPLSEDPAKRANTYISSDSDWIKFNTVVSTAADQTAIAPGKLIKTWIIGNRRYFHYQTQAPILNFYAYLSGHWAVKRAQWHDVKLSVYYNPAHYWNVNDLIASAKDSLSYYTKHFGPYQFKHLRIIEFPNFDGAFAQSFAGTVAFSEAVGFIARLKSRSAINYPFYIAAHEIAHQWWAHQVIGANMQGATMLSESLAQYSALMVMKHHYGPNKMRRFLKYELDHYLARRILDRGGETPLGKVEGQTYIRYRKASVVFYALQDYIGEDVIDSALHTFDQTYRFKGPPYPTSIDLVNDIKAAAGPKWDQLIDDSFWKITLYDNRVIWAKAKKLPDGKYQVTMRVHAAKYYANAEGKQTPAKLNLPIDIGVFGKAANGVEGDEPVLYLKKQKVANGDSTITLTVDAKPYQVGIDPYNELVDRNSNDNRAKVSFQ
ncbi:MAG TPA: M1 family aminopeptidase [Rhodanobacteraceae bacterium]